MANTIYNSVIRLFSVPFTEKDNILLDDPNGMGTDPNIKVIGQYANFQYIRAAIDQTIKIRIDNHVDPVAIKQEVNYCIIADRISNYDESSTLTDPVFYYITNVDVLDTDTVRLTLRMDTLATFAYHSTETHKSVDIPWEDHTRIMRQHKDRWTPNASKTFVFPKIDYKSEGIQTSKIKTTDTAITTTDGKWYIVYKTLNDIGSEGSNPVSVYLACAGTFNINRTGYILQPSDLEFGIVYYVHWVQFSHIIDDAHDYTSGQAFIQGYTLEGCVFWLNDDGSIQVMYIGENSGGSQSLLNSHTTTQIKITGCNFCYTAGKGSGNPTLYKNSTALQRVSLDKYYLGDNPKIIKIDDINRSNPRLLKIVEFPYLPIDLDIVNGVVVLDSYFSYIGGYLRYNGSINRVNYAAVKSVLIPNLDTHSNTPAVEQDPLTGYLEEPKLLHSDFYTVKFVFDSFYYDVALERLTSNYWTEWPANNPQVSKFNIFIYPSLNVSSSFLFYVQSSYLQKASDYEGFFAIKRNNEVALYNSAYLNYMRNGYNFDIKQKAIQENAQIASTVIIGVEMVASFASSVYTGGAGVAAGVALATSLAASTISYANTISSNEVSMASRLASLQNQGASVTGAEDLDLLHVYSPNLHVEIYETSQYERDAIIQALRLRGYACDEFGKPNTHTRIYFNYLQCGAMFKFDTVESNIINAQIVDDVTTKFAEGVYFMHSPTGSKYDFYFQWENWETNLMN